MRWPSLALYTLLLAQSAEAGPLRDWLAERRADNPVPQEIAYGDDPRQRLDIYRPAGTQPAPILWMVHGGAWRTGDKRNSGVIDNKVARWQPQGFVLVSVNYRLLPEASVAKQLADLRLALQRTQQQAAEWGGDPAQMVLLGHSAGAHLVALLNADLAASTRLGIEPWRGAVLLDSAVLDLPAIMHKPHYRFYDQAFGTDPAYWHQLSPLHQLQKGAPPVLAVCSSQRPDQSCAQAHAFADSLQRLGSRAEVLPQPLSHKAINHELGLDNAYTRQVEVFLASLGAGLQQRLQPRNDNGPDKPGR